MRVAGPPSTRIKRIANTGVVDVPRQRERVGGAHVAATPLPVLPASGSRPPSEQSTAGAVQFLQFPSIATEEVLAPLRWRAPAGAGGSSAHHASRRSGRGLHRPAHQGCDLPARDIHPVDETVDPQQLGWGRQAEFAHEVGGLAEPKMYLIEVIEDEAAHMPNGRPAVPTRVSALHPNRQEPRPAQATAISGGASRPQSGARHCSPGGGSGLAGSHGRSQVQRPGRPSP